MAEEIVIKGLDELQRKLETLPRELARKILRDDLREVGEEQVEHMVAAAPVSDEPRNDPGFLAEHFDMRVTIHHGELAGTAYIGPQGKMYYPDRGEEKYGVATGKYPKKHGQVPVASVARFLEFGTSTRAKHPFMTEAFEEYKDTALEKIIAGIRSELEKWTK